MEWNFPLSQKFLGKNCLAYFGLLAGCEDLNCQMWVEVIFYSDS